MKRTREEALSNDGQYKTQDSDDEHQQDASVQEVEKEQKNVTETPAEKDEGGLENGATVEGQQRQKEEQQQQQEEYDFNAPSEQDDDNDDDDDDDDDERYARKRRRREERSTATEATETAPSQMAAAITSDAKAVPSTQEQTGVPGTLPLTTSPSPSPSPTVTATATALPTTFANTMTGPPSTSMAPAGVTTFPNTMFSAGFQQQQQQYQQHQQQYQEDLSGTNLFINFLPPYMDDMQLKQLFSPFGEILSCKVMINIATRQSRGFGFVQYRSPEQAASAIASMNGFRLDNKILQVKHAQSNAAENLGTPNTNLYIKGIPHNVDKTQLQQTFSRFGTVVDCIVIIDYQTQQSRGVGFCRFSTLDEAKRVITACQGRMDVFPGQTEKLELKYANERKSNPTGGMQQRTTRFNPSPGLGANMPHQMPLPQMPQYPQNPYFDYMAAAQFYASMYGYTPEQTAQMYAGYGTVPTPYQYGAWPGMMGAGVGATGATGASVPVPAGGSGSTIVVYNLPDDASRPVVLNLLKTYGRMDNIQILTDPNNKSSKYAMVTFSNPASATKAVQGVNQTKLGNRTITANLVSQ